MPEKLIWTEPRDAQLKRMRSQGLPWDAIAAALGISRNAAIERGRRIGARLPPPEYVPEPEDKERPPLPPGHPASWGAIVAGTCLEGTPYPLPVPSAMSATKPEPARAPGADMSAPQGGITPNRTRAALRGLGGTASADSEPIPVPA